MFEFPEDVKTANKAAMSYLSPTKPYPTTAVEDMDDISPFAVSESHRRADEAQRSYRARADSLMVGRRCKLNPGLTID